MARDMNNISERWRTRNGKRELVLQVRVRLHDDQGKKSETKTKTFDGPTMYDDAIVWRDTKRSQVKLGEIGDKRAANEHWHRETFHHLIMKYKYNAYFKSKASYGNELDTINAFMNHVIGRKMLDKSIIDIRNAGSRFFIIYRDTRQSEGVSNATINRELNPFRNLFKIARGEWGYPVDPFKDWKALDEGPGREPTLKPEDDVKLYHAINKQCRTPLLRMRWELLVTLALTTALRRRPLLKLKRKDIDKIRDVINIPRSYWNGKKKAPPMVPITRGFSGLLGNYLARLPADDNTPLFPAKQMIKKVNGKKVPVFLADGTPVMTNSGYDSTWKRIVHRAGLYTTNERGDIKYFTFHDLRHIAVTRLADKPIELSVRENDYLLGKYVGGKSGRERYEHLELIGSIRDKLDIAGLKKNISKSPPYVFTPPHGGYPEDQNIKVLTSEK